MTDEKNQIDESQDDEESVEGHAVHMGPSERGNPNLGEHERGNPNLGEFGRGNPNLGEHERGNPNL